MSGASTTTPEDARDFFVRACLDGSDKAFAAWARAFGAQAVARAFAAPRTPTDCTQLNEPDTRRRLTD